MDLVKEAITEVSRGQLPSTDVLSLLASRLLGYCITLGASMIKVPQILAVHRSKSVQGLSILSFELELLITAIHSSYGLIIGLDISAYGEAIVMFVQSIILLASIYWYGNVSKPRSMMVYTLLAIGGALVYMDHVSAAQISAAYTMNQVFFLVARCTQIVKNIREGSTGQLSLVSSTLTTVGCMARILTSLRENAELTFVLGFVQGTVLNGIVVLQILYYKAKKAAEKKED